MFVYLLLFTAYSYIYYTTQKNPVYMSFSKDFYLEENLGSFIDLELKRNESYLIKISYEKNDMMHHEWSVVNDIDEDINGLNYYISENKLYTNFLPMFGNIKVYKL